MSSLSFQSESNNSGSETTASSSLRKSDCVTAELTRRMDRIRGSNSSIGGESPTKRASQRLDSLTVNKLRFSSLGLLGRDTELETLQQCLDRCCSDHTRELVLVAGLSGTGKSALVNHFVEQRTASRAVKAGWGKFDFFLRDEPLSGFCSAFSSLCAQLLENLTVHSKAFVDFRVCLLEAIDKDDELALLASMIPNLQQFLEPSMANSQPGTSAATISVSDTLDSTITPTPVLFIEHGGGNPQANGPRMKHVFRKLCRVLTEHFAPLVIVLDDVQWADKASLDLLQALVTDRQNSKILFIACFRSDQVLNHDDTENHNNNSSNKNLVVNLWENATTTPDKSNITNIQVGNLSLPHVHSIINTLLAMDDDPEQTLELANICHRRTLGNCFFLLQFLVMLKEEGLLQFNLGLFQWKWDLPTIDAETAATANVVGMVKGRLLSKLQPQLLSFLQLASCLGSSFHDRILALAWDQVNHNDNADDTERDSFQSLLSLAVQGNFLEQGRNGIEYPSHRWLHDSIQEAAMASISSPIDLFKHRVGMTLLQHLTQEELNQNMFVVANLLTDYNNKNKNNTRPDNDLQLEIDLFLRAAEKASSVAAFQSTFRYAKSGIALLPTECWETCFDQSVRLYSLATEASAVLGHLDEMLEYSGVVLDQPKCSIFDKLRIYFVKLELLQNNGDSFEAVDLGLQLLSKLGCSFPKSTVGQVYKTIKTLQKYKKKTPTEAFLRQLPPMTDRNSKEIVKIIFRLEASFYYTKQIFLYALASAQTVKLILERGLCDYSAGAVFALGNILAVIHGDLKYLERWSELSMLMTELVPGHHESRACFASNCGFTWCKPMHILPKSLLHGYEVGMKVGDTESAMWNCCHNLYFDFMAGRSLGKIEERCHLFISNMIEFKRNEAALVSEPMWRLVLALIGSQDLLSTELSSESHGNQKAIDEVMGTTAQQISPVAPYFSRVTLNMLHAYRREYVVGADLAITRGNEFLSNLPSQPMGAWDTFLRGLCLYAAAKETGKRRYLRHAKKVRATVEKWYKQGDPNIRHHATLLAAEELSLQKKFDKARQSYESSILAASRGGFVHDAAIANERYGCCLLNELKDTENARYHLGVAYRLYNEWGAKGIANGLHHVDIEIPKE